MNYPYRRSVNERTLAKHLQPIRNYVLAYALHSFFELGAFDELDQKSKISIQELCQQRGLSFSRLKALLEFLSYEGYVELIGADEVQLTSLGKELGPIRPWYELLVGGYSPLFADLPSLLKNCAPYGNRDSEAVGRGSCGISQHDALPMTKRLLRRIGGKMATVLDLGCGDGSFLINICLDNPEFCGIGIDATESSIESARKLATDVGIEDRVCFQSSRLPKFPVDLSDDQSPVMVAAFLLQEILEQIGREHTVELLTDLFVQFPKAHMIVVEVDRQSLDGSTIPSELGLAYYNPYYFIHALTEQRLETDAFWVELFEECGLDVVARDYPNGVYDSTNLKIAYLLRGNTHD